MFDLMSRLMQPPRFFSDRSIWSSAASGWNSVHLRQYCHESHVEEVNTPPALDQVVVLVTKGSTLIERFANGRWSSAAHVPGRIGMTMLGETNRLRWRGPECHETLHLHLPPPFLMAALEDASEFRSSGAANASVLSVDDQVVAAVMLSLVRAADAGAPDLYAESAAHFLARHIVLNGMRCETEAPYTFESARIRRLEDYMNAHLSADLTLKELAEIAGCSTFQVIRIFKAHWKQSPIQRLTQLRMEAARSLLQNTTDSVTSIAFDCGYSNPSHFATAFRRIVGMSPSDFRQS